MIVATFNRETGKTAPASWQEHEAERAALDTADRAIAALFAKESLRGISPATQALLAQALGEIRSARASCGLNEKRCDHDWKQTAGGVECTICHSSMPGTP